MQKDSIMDLVNNMEPLYNRVQDFYLRWYRENLPQWKAKMYSQSLAVRLARDIGQGHGQRHVSKAAKEILEDFVEFKRYHEDQLKAAAKAEAEEAALVRMWESSLTREDAEQAKHYETIVRRAGISFLKPLIPVSREQIRESLEQGDYSLDIIPYEKWLRAAEQIPYLPGKGLNWDEKVLSLKHVARWHYA